MNEDALYETLHIKHYGYEMARCRKCDVNDPLYVVTLDDGTDIVVHQQDVVFEGDLEFKKDEEEGGEPQ